MCKNKSFRLVLLAFVAVLVVVAVVGCAETPTNGVRFFFEGVVYKEVFSNGNQSIPMPEDPYKDGYVFKGWYFDGGTWQKPFDADYFASTPIEEMVNVFARVVSAEEAARRATITFDVQGGTAVNHIEIEKGTKIAAPETSKDGKILDGWYLEETFETEWNFAVDTADSDVTLYAKWVDAGTQYTVKFVDYDGTVISTQQVVYGSSATEAIRPARSGYRFSGWSKKFDRVREDLTITAQYVKQYTVEFVDYDGTVLGIQLIDVGGSATEPTPPERENFAFVGWDIDYSTCTTDTTITAQYVRQYTVEFLVDGASIATQKVNEGNDAELPETPKKEGFDFVSWDGDYSSVSSNLTLNAIFEVSRHRVTFRMPNGVTIAEHKDVLHGSAVIAPTSMDNRYFDWASRKVYEFSQWDKPFDNITEDTIVTALYNKNVSSNKSFIIVETVEATQYTNTVNIRISVKGDFSKLYGLSFRVTYDDNLVLKTDPTLNPIFSRTQNLNLDARANDSLCEYKFSFTHTTGLVIDQYLEIATLTLTITDGTSETCGIIIDADEAMLVNQAIESITPDIINGAVVIK